MRKSNEAKKEYDELREKFNYNIKEIDLQVKIIEWAKEFYTQKVNDKLQIYEPNYMRFYNPNENKPLYSSALNKFRSYLKHFYAYGREIHWHEIRSIRSNTRSVPQIDNFYLDIGINFTTFRTGRKESVPFDKADFYQQLFTDSIDCIKYIYQKIRELYLEKLQLSPERYTLQLYKVYDQKDMIYDNPIVRPCPVYDLQREPFAVFLYDYSQSEMYQRFVLGKDYNVNGNEIPFKCPFQVTNEDGSYVNGSFHIFYRTIIAPTLNYLAYNQAYYINKRRNGVNYEDIKITNIFDEYGNLKKECCINCRNSDKYENMAPVSLGLSNILNNLTIVIKDKERNNHITFISNINRKSYKFKVVKECTGFNEAIAFKTHKNSTEELQIYNLDTAAKYRDVQCKLYDIRFSK